MLSKTIIKLRKLQYLCGGDIRLLCVNPYEGLPDDLSKLCVACCAPKLMQHAEMMDGQPNTSDMCAFCCCALFPVLARGFDPRGVIIPRGVRKLKGLQTLGVVNIAGGKSILQDIKSLTQLRKLAVMGINKKNCQEFFSAIAGLSNLESLTVKPEWRQGLPGLHGCLDGVSSPPINLQSLKLYEDLAKLPEWIEGLQNLAKLQLDNTKLLDLDGTIQVLGKLPNLAILRLRWKSFQGEQLHLNFHQELFPSLTVLELFFLDSVRLIDFERGAMLKLELLLFFGTLVETNTVLFSGLAFLKRLKEFMIFGSGKSKDEFIGNEQSQLAENPNGPVLKRLSHWDI